MSADDKLLLAKNSIAELSHREAERVLAEAVVKTGELARTMRGKGLKTWIKGEDSPVSDADIAADALLRERLTAAAPDYEWLSEESAEIADKPTHRRRWVVDPIDGTRAFIKGQADWCISAALVENGRPAAAALYAPATDELFTASLGNGAERNGARIAVSAQPALAGARVAGPRFMLERLAGCGIPHEAVPRIHSLALRFARAAAGEIDLALASANSHDWDLAAADLLVHEAGGLLTDPAGRKIVYGHPDARHPVLAASGPALHPQVLDALGKILANTAA